MRTCTKAVLWGGVSVVLCTIVACNINIDTDDESITISNKVFSLKLAASGVFELRIGAQPVQNKMGVPDLFSSQTPSDTPGSAVVSLDSDDITVVPLGAPKLQPTSQTISGTAELNIYVGPSTTTEPCDDGIFIGTFFLTFSDSVVTIDRVSLDIPSQALAWLFSGSFTLCLEMSADVDVQIIIDGIDIEFGPPVEEPVDNLNDNVSDNLNDNLDDNLNDNVDDNLNDNVDENVNDNIDDNLNDNVDDNLNDNVDDNLNDNVDDNLNDNVAPTFTLAITIEGQGSVDPPGGAYDEGEWLTLTATPADGWRFYSWMGAVSGRDNPASVTMSEDRSLTAIFVPIVASEITFRAVYDRLWDTGDQDPGYVILHAAMSGDGNRLVWAVQDNDTGAFSIVTTNVDGSDKTVIPTPPEVDSIWGVAINYDGSRAFFHRWLNLLYKVENGVITQILNTGDHSEIAGVQSLQPTTSGDYVYFLDDGINDNDVWRVSHAGGAPELIVNDTAVIYDNGYAGAQVSEFSSSADGGTIAFTMFAYWGDGGYAPRMELFVLDGGGFRQLTSNPEGVNKGAPTISGDGSTIVYYADYTWYSIRPDGSNLIDLGAAGFNLGGPQLTYDGSKMFYSDSESEGTVLLNTDGSGRQNPVPSWNITNIAIGASRHHAVSDDGTRVSFFTEFGILPLNAAYYVGYLNELHAITPSVPDAPSIDRIAFSPPAYPRIDPDASLYVHASISDPNGLTDVTNVAADELVDGVHAGYDQVPAYFYFAPRDDGEAPDDLADDGVFVSAASPGDMLQAMDEVTVRISAMDAEKTIVVADTLLTVVTE